VQNTRNMDTLTGALLDLTGFLNSPRRDDLLLRMAGVSLDRALFPLLMRLGMQGPLAVADLADLAGRDHTTVSRQLAKLESLDLVERPGGDSDRRRRPAALTDAGRQVVAAIGEARQRALSEVLEDWNQPDQAALASLVRRFADDLIMTADRKR
jgi:DNA-binding MarR family transcriptional regulator